MKRRDDGYLRRKMSRRGGVGRGKRKLRKNNYMLGGRGAAQQKLKKHLQIPRCSFDTSSSRVEVPKQRTIRASRLAFVICFCFVFNPVLLRTSMFSTILVLCITFYIQGNLGFPPGLFPNKKQGQALNKKPCARSFIICFTRSFVIFEK